MICAITAETNYRSYLCRISIDNNVSERTLRHQAIGRKNWLFLGSAQAGPRAAVLFTILAGAKRHRIEPWTYLRELLLRLHDDDPRLDEMLPINGRPITPKPCSPIGSKNPAAKRPHAARVVVTPAQPAQPVDQRRDTMASAGRLLESEIVDMCSAGRMADSAQLCACRRRYTDASPLQSVFIARASDRSSEWSSESL